MSPWNFRRTRRAADLPTPLSDAFIAASKAGVRTILFADDDPAIGEMVQLLQGRMAMEITIVRTVAEAREALAKRVFDIAILDYRLLNGNTIPIYEQLLSMRPKTYVIFLTGGSLDAVSREVHARGPAPVYPKPEALQLSFLAKVLVQLGVSFRAS